MARFNFLFSGNASDDLQHFLEWLDLAGPGIGFTELEIDDCALKSALDGMYRMPWWNGEKNASPFKKAAAFTTNFTHYNPIISNLPKQPFEQLFDHQNAIVAYEASRFALTEATIQCPYRGPLTLRNKITTSKHYWKELISTLSYSNPRDHFSLVSLIYEQLAYNANPEASYAHFFRNANPEVIH